MPLTPQTARTDEQIALLKTDHLDTPEFWFVVEPLSVTLAQQRQGESAKAEIKIPKTHFDQFVKFYLEG